MEKIDPNEAVALLNDYLDRMVGIAFHHGGTLDRIVGDAVAIMFSAPVVQPDHRERALQCALEMHEFATRYSADQAAKGTHFGKTRIGIHTGAVLAGTVGSARRRKFTTVGDAVNLAAHLEAHTKVLGRPILIDENTRAGLGDGFRIDAHGPTQIKTRSRAVPIYSVTGTN